MRWPWEPSGRKVFCKLTIFKLSISLELTLSILQQCVGPGYGFAFAFSAYFEESFPLKKLKKQFSNHPDQIHPQKLSDLSHRHRNIFELIYRKLITRFPGDLTDVTDNVWIWVSSPSNATQILCWKFNYIPHLRRGSFPSSSESKDSINAAVIWNEPASSLFTRQPSRTCAYPLVYSWNLLIFHILNYAAMCCRWHKFPSATVNLLSQHTAPHRRWRLESFPI